MRYTVYGTNRSSNCSIECALAEADEDYDFVDVSLASNAQLDDEFAKINPAHKIPALCLPSGETITESAAILLTIAERHPDSGLLPPIGSDARAIALRWIAFCASEIYPMVEIIDYPERFASAGQESEVLRERARARLRNRCLILEKGILGYPWILETGFSVADLYAANLTRWDVGKEWRDENCPKIERLTAAIAARPKSGPVWRLHFG